MRVHGTSSKDKEDMLEDPTSQSQLQSTSQVSFTQQCEHRQQPLTTQMVIPDLLSHVSMLGGA